METSHSVSIELYQKLASSQSENPPPHVRFNSDLKIMDFINIKSKQECLPPTEVTIKKSIAGPDGQTLSSKTYKYNEPPFETITEAEVFIRDQEEAAERTTCSDYLKRTWPSIGPELILIVKHAICNKMEADLEEKAWIEKTPKILPDGTKLEAWVDESGCLVIEVTGSFLNILQVGEAVAWMTAALKLVDKKEIAYIKPNMTFGSTSEDSSWEVYISSECVDGTAGYEYLYTVVREIPSLPSYHRYPRVVLGFPVQHRPTKMQGLEVSPPSYWKKIDPSTTHNKTAMFREISKRAYVATEYDDDNGIILWLVIEDVTRNPVEDPRVAAAIESSPLEKNLEESVIEIARHILFVSNSS
ncbi:hypothetical protein GGI42DRAFT_221980 [Trichoderma sp. SZMC 28013]